MTKEELMMSRDIVEILNFKNKNKDSNLSYKKEMFYKKYSTYYKHPQIKTKINFYKNSINGNNVTVVKKESINLKRLYKVIDIYKSDLDLYNKIDKITNIFKDYNELWLSYYDLIIPLIDSNFIKDLNKVFILLKNNKDTVEFIRYYSDNIKKYNNYDYAKFIINSYLSKEFDENLEDFIYRFGIDKKIFEYCVDTICEFDVELYNKFEQIKKINDSNERYNNKKKLERLAFDIQNNFNKGICSYSVSEFFKRVPFKYERNFSNTLLSFIKENDPKNYEVFYDYIYINKLYKKNIIKELNLDEILNSFIVYNEEHIGNNDKLRVLTYMKDNNYPMINVVFYDLLKKIVNRELILTEIKDIKKRKILIP